MAPSRALLRRITSASKSTRPYTHALRQTSRALSTYTQHRPDLQPNSTCRTRFPAISISSTRPYSQAGAAPQPPDYLNEAELHIFNKIKGELEPVKLEVRPPIHQCGVVGAEMGAAWLTPFVHYSACCETRMTCIRILRGIRTHSVHLHSLVDSLNSR
jgi:hypothetical protein